MTNYEFFSDFASEAARTDKSFSVLDYGCGAGQIVAALREKQVEAFGCDIFYEGGDYSESVPDGMLGTTIRKIEDGRIPFSSETFDLVINNQVLEHVEDLEIVLQEMHRALKPGGKLLSMFPDKSVWREGHLGIPFLHWFPKKSRARVYYAMLLRAFGLGHFKGSKGYFEWSKDGCEWLDNWTHYRSFSEIMNIYRKYYVNIQFIDEHWLNKRLGDSNMISKYFPPAIKRIVVRKLAGLIFVCTKPS
jgi:SAM-dependent methyltransferase